MPEEARPALERADPALRDADGLRVDARNGFGEVVLELHGEADLATAPTLREALTAATGNGRTRVVLDLTALEFIDAHCLGIIADHRLVGQSSEVVLRSPSPMVSRILTIVAWDGPIEPAAT